MLEDNLNIPEEKQSKNHNESNIESSDLNEINSESQSTATKSHDVDSPNVTDDGLKIVVSEDKMQAFLIFNEISQIEVLSNETLKNKLVELGIKSEVRQDFFVDISEKNDEIEKKKDRGDNGDNDDKEKEEEKIENKILIAIGKEPENGKNGYLRFYFETKTGAKEDDMGNVDHKNISLIQSVKTGQRIAECVPPEKGIAGGDLYGSEIKANDGTLINMPGGKNTDYDPKDSNFLISKIDGHVKLESGFINVHSEVMLSGDIDYSTGNINFLGDVTINGEVKSGFKVSAKGNIEIKGLVGDAEIVAEGNVVLLSGFKGKGGGTINSKGDVTIKYCENQNINCEGDLKILDYILFSNIQTKGKLTATDGKGLIIGGNIFALKGIETNTIGNDKHSTTNLFAGVDKEIYDNITNLKGDLKKVKENFEILKRSIDIINVQKMLKRKLPESKLKLISKLILTLDSIINEDNQLKEDINLLYKNLEEYKNSKIIIHKDVYPGTKMKILKFVKEIDEKDHSVIFSLTEDKIITNKIEE